MNKRENSFLCTIHQWYSHSHLILIIVSYLVFLQGSFLVTATNGTSMSSMVITSHFTHVLPSNNSSPAKYESKSGQVHSRKKRGIMELAGMISCVTGCDPIKYKGYGCYCGYSGVGMPVDAIDR